MEFAIPHTYFIIILAAAISVAVLLMILIIYPGILQDMSKIFGFLRV